MRPEILSTLFQPATALKGIGPKVAKAIEKLLPSVRRESDPRVLDLLLHMPVNYVDRRNQPGIANAQEGAIVTLKVVVDEHRPPPRGNKRVPYRIAVHDDTDSLTLTYFHAHGDWLQKSVPIGEIRYVSGKIERYNGFANMVHPDFVASEVEFLSLPPIEPVYPMTAGLSPKTFQNGVRQSFGLLPPMPEWIDPAVISRHDWPSFGRALTKVHAPDSVEGEMVESADYQRLAYDELLASQLALSLTRRRMKKAKGRAKVGNGRYVEALLKSLPFQLTEAQKQSVEEIHQDMANEDRMTRLLQGDVGAGKTVVALLAMARAAEAGYQSMLMAPTEILARQHFASIDPLAQKVGLKIAVLTGREKGKARTKVLSGLEDGSIDFLVGTHALFQSGVELKKLGLAIVDEQHRFGVHQRLALAAKGQAADMLVMTATPIPRTLVLTYFGDMDVSRLTGKPAGRQHIDTATMSLDRLDDIAQRISKVAMEGQQVYWVCPLVEESELIDLTSAEDRFKHLSQVLSVGVELIHGRMTSEEKEAAMARFKSGEARVLVATTVIEVGVDVPDASIIVIEHAERFGLSQLHQLRGRVGRGSKKSSCLLLYKGPLGEVAKARLQVMKETEDGFRIAEEDLKLRGEGDVLGTKQSGQAGFRIARLPEHMELLTTARDDARLVSETNSSLEGERGEALRCLLYLFDRDEAVRLLDAG